MGRRVFFALNLMALLMSGYTAQAQLDSSSAVLLKSGGQGPSRQSLDSSRYKIRAPESRRDSNDLDERPVRSAEPQKPAEPLIDTSEAKPLPISTVVPMASPVGEMSSDADNVHPPVTVQVRELILGGDGDIEDYRAHIHPQDPRANMLSISLAPAYFYDGSTSNYSYRNYHSDGPGFGLGMNVWFTPFFGVQSKYFSSVSSGVHDAGGSVVPVDTQEFEAGIRFRRHFGYSRKSAQLSWGIDYHDSSNKISQDATETMGRKTSGLSLSLEGTIPTSVTYAHLFEVALRPSQHHSEVQTTVMARSGSKSQTNAVHLGLGGQWTLDRRNQVFWKGQYSVERNLFDGPVSQPDAHGNSPDGVSVTNSLLIFYFGFKWGS